MYEDNDTEYNAEDVAWFLASEEDELNYLRQALGTLEGMES